MSFRVGAGKFSTSYADSAELEGFVGRDVVQLGDYYAFTRFGCIRKCNDPHFNGVCIDNMRLSVASGHVDIHGVVTQALTVFSALECLRQHHPPRLFRFFLRCRMDSPQTIPTSES